MKSLKCDLCESEIQGETFDNWFKAMHAHWTVEHADKMKEMQETGTKEEGEKWMADAKAKFDAAPSIPLNSKS